MLGRVIRQSGTYVIAGLVGKGSGVVLTAFYVNTAYLPVEDFGYFGAIRAAMMMALLIAGAGIPLGVIRFSTSPAVGPEQRSAVASTALTLAVVSGALTALAIWAAAPLVAGLLAGQTAPDPSRADLVRLFALYILIKTVGDVAYAELRHREKVGWYVVLSAVESAVLLGATLLFLVVLGEGLRGVMKGYVAAAAVTSVIGTVGLLRVVPWRPTWSLVGPMLAFGAPLILSGLAARFLYFGDRFIITPLAGLDATARYELASQFGSLVYTVLVQGVQLSFTVVGMKAMGGPETGPLYRRAFRHYTAAVGLAVLGVGLYANAAARLFATDEAYLGIDLLVVLVAGGFGLQGLYAITVSALYGAGRTRTVAAGVGASALVNVVLNLALIPIFGVAGAALATLGSYVLLAVWSGRVAETIVEVRFPWRALVATGAVVGALWWLGTRAGDTDWAGLGLRAVPLLLYPAALVAVGVYGRADLRAGLERVRAWRR